MYRRLSFLAALLLVTFPLTFGFTADQPKGDGGKGAGGVSTGKVDQERVDKLIEDWPAKPKETAREMIEKYGPPNEATASLLIWHNNGPWKRTFLYKEEVPHEFPMPHTDMLEQFIDFKAPPEKFDELALYDGSVYPDRTKGEISARCDKEEMNFLAINLAQEVATGKRSVEEAKKFYAETVKAFKEGKSSPYTQGFRFDVAKGGTADPDKKIG
ncbi:MAG: hypothetical protein LLH30_18850 [Candidatus Manganitrophus sp. SA1]|nr:hypothetical protein [Candidatus Manganitrophus morganii]